DPLAQVPRAAPVVEVHGDLGWAGALAGTKARRRRRPLGAGFRSVRLGGGGQAALIAAAWQRLELLATEEPLEIVAVQALPFQESERDDVELVQIVGKELLRLVVRALDEASHLLVDHDRGLLAVVAALGDLLAQEHVL